MCCFRTICWLSWQKQLKNLLYWTYFSWIVFLVLKTFQISKTFETTKTFHILMLLGYRAQLSWYIVYWKKRLSYFTIQLSLFFNPHMDVCCIFQFLLHQWHCLIFWALWCLKTLLLNRDILDYIIIVISGKPLNSIMINRITKQWI